jgi:hypothetical protein
VAPVLRNLASWISGGIGAGTPKGRNEGTGMLDNVRLAALSDRRLMGHTGLGGEQQVRFSSSSEPVAPEDTEPG